MNLGPCIGDFFTYNLAASNGEKLLLIKQIAGVAQWLERHVANVNVVGSNPITRSWWTLKFHTIRNARSVTASVFSWFFIGFIGCRFGYNAGLKNFEI